jgi:alanine-glyoxylate transaminase/serine-glyoxylate transaminase/serine-pyruvate transaminase
VSTTESKKKPVRGRLFFANPGPTNIPDSIMRAVAQPTVDFMSAPFLALYDDCMVGLKRILKTKQHIFFYTASGHGAWEAALVNVMSPGDTLLIVETGYFSLGWAEMAEALGLKVQTVAADWRRGVDVAAVAAALAADTEHKIKAVGVVHNETATGVSLSLPPIRAALDASGHPALLLADTISSLCCFDFRMDEWGIDVVVGGSQKGLMLPTGMSFTGVSDKALEAHKTSTMPKHYLNWTAMMGRRHKSFIGTVPITFFYGLAESLRLLEEEGLDQVFARHHRLAEATRRAVRAWSGNNGPQLFCLDPSRYSDSVTAIMVPEGFNAEELRKVCFERFNVSLGGGLGPLGGKVFRIGHMGDLNEPMILGTLAAVEMGLSICGIPHAKGGVDAAMAYLAEMPAEMANAA